MTTEPRPSEIVSNDPIHVPSPAPFVDRRTSGAERKSAGLERRQFSNSYHDLSADAAELGRAIDAYKLEHRRRFINYEEMLGVILSLGYRKISSAE